MAIYSETGGTGSDSKENRQKARQKHNDSHAQWFDNSNFENLHIRWFAIQDKIDDSYGDYKLRRYGTQEHLAQHLTGKGGAKRKDIKGCSTKNGGLELAG
eukprot:8747707-Heterocapsa_arctica.AAC.1